MGFSLPSAIIPIMVLNSTIYKADLQIADMDRHYYEQHSLVLAKHPSETDERMMVRLLAFAIYAEESLEFGKGISADDEPALWLKDLTGDIVLWIEIGQPDERIIRKACGRANQVVLIVYGSNTELWWKNNKSAFAQRKNLTVLQLLYKDTQVIAAMAERNMTLACNIEDGEISLSDGKICQSIEPVILQSEG